MAKGNNEQFIADIAKFRIKSERTINDTRKFIAYEIFSRVVDRTPIYFQWHKHSGTAKYNWKCTLNTLSTKVLKGTDKKGDSTKARMLKVLDRSKDDNAIYFANSVPYIMVLEDGLYPKSVSKGSWNKQTKKYEIRSVGGFSKQAPHGMVKVTLTTFSAVSAQALRKAQSKNP